jgi:hypothetical protein
MIFNRTGKIRVFCLGLAENQETLKSYQDLLNEGKLEEYSQNKSNQQKKVGNMFAQTQKGKKADTK